MCGADQVSRQYSCSRLGSSPRVRSRRSVAQPHEIIVGIISACAEQTMGGNTIPLHDTDHLRVCGADFPFSLESAPGTGSSPRVRSRRRERADPHHRSGIISACAEQTYSRRSRDKTRRDHLRVCGADPMLSIASPAVWGSSPRVRSRHIDFAARILFRGIISACAEQTVR